MHIVYPSDGDLIDAGMQCILDKDTSQLQLGVSSNLKCSLRKQLFFPAFMKTTRTGY